MQCCVQLPLLKNKLENSVQIAKDYASCHGIVLRTDDNPESAEQVSYAPMLLLPSPVPKHCYQEAVAVQNDFNVLIHKIAHDYEFLRDSLASTIKVDDFTRRLWGIYETVRNEGIAQPFSLGLLRSDYMFACGMSSEDALKSEFDPSNCVLKQIEINTIASSFGGLCSNVSKLHKLIVEEMCCPNGQPKESPCPKNNATDGIASGMVAAWEQYGNENAVVLFVVSKDERNVYDQRLVEFSVREQKPGIKVIRRSLQDLTAEATLDENKNLNVGGSKVAVVYFRMAYMPHHFTGEEDWNTKLLIERSNAIKCPSVYYHLAGTKKVQQVLARPGVVERYISDPDAVKRIRNTFAGQYTLDMGEDGDRTVKMALENPEKFVLKPQREGGGNNTYGADIPKMLNDISNSKERTAYILMERIQPAPLRNYALKPNNKVQLLEMVSELGIFGIVVGSADKMTLSKQQGHILRTKRLGTDEGGVSAGFAALDSPYLI